MDLKYLNSDFFIRNRNKLGKNIKQNSIVFVCSADELPRNGDQNFNYRQNSDLFYLTGINQEKSILVLSPNHPNEKYREMLFIRKSSKDLEIWYGHKLTKDEAKDISGIENIFFTDNFDSIVRDLMYYLENVYISTNENLSFSRFYNDSDFRFIEEMKFKFPLHNYQRLAPVLTEMRLKKETEEIETIKHSVEITKNAFLRVLKFVKPDVSENEIEAEITHEFIRQKAKNHAYQPIVASGKNTCVLHYIENDKQCKNGDLLLMDFGAEFQNYAADLSRTIPINGKFSERQKEVYNSVLYIQKEAIKMMVKGKTINNLNRVVSALMEKELITLGLLNKEEVKNQNSEEPLYKKYFMHGTSHFMGLDVHDVGTRDTVFESGMILTCEPGIYIPEENIGIRLENDILITENGNIDLMADIPIEIDEIENIMKKIGL
jgi:Xaa-Pro aminopeptidase